MRTRKLQCFLTPTSKRQATCNVSSRRVTERLPTSLLLLGAGASQTSNVITATEMISEWRRMLFAESAALDYEDWRSQQVWYGHDDEYSILFEHICDRPAQRRVYIEECLKDCHPTWGYAYLTNLLTHRYFDVVFTTNFDDLINEACYLYSDEMRPIVAAHDSANPRYPRNFEPPQNYQTARRLPLR